MSLLRSLCIWGPDLPKKETSPLRWPFLTRSRVHSFWILIDPRENKLLPYQIERKGP